VSARVSTIGSEVVDAFYVRDAAGAKVTRPEELQRIELAVKAVVDRRPDPDRATEPALPRRSPGER
jgi:UTP:GlnB (protein PII) uridylyltransferase